MLLLKQADVGRNPQAIFHIILENNVATRLEVHVLQKMKHQQNAVITYMLIIPFQYFKVDVMLLGVHCISFRGFIPQRRTSMLEAFLPIYDMLIVAIILTKV